MAGPMSQVFRPGEGIEATPQLVVKCAVRKPKYTYLPAFSGAPFSAQQASGTEAGAEELGDLNCRR